MFAPSLGRAVRSTGSIASTPATSLCRAAFNTAHQPFRPTHQRRLSSSKPSIPPSNKKEPAKEPAPDKKLGQTAATHLQGRGTQTKANGKVTEAKDAEWANNLPRAPPTAHQCEEDVKISAFFGLHRPLSKYPETWQPPAGMEVFDAIFHQPKTNDVYSVQQTQRTQKTLNDFLQNLHDGIDQHEEMQAHARYLHAEANHMNELPTEESITYHASQLPHFTPPPPPVAFDPFATQPAPRPSQVLSTIMNQRITEVSLPSEQTEQPATFREHVHRRRGGMYMISVKRQRKLKMKKHKYKKLMKRTRLLRRKLDRA